MNIMAKARQVVISFQVISHFGKKCIFLYFHGHLSENKMKNMAKENILEE